MDELTRCLRQKLTLKLQTTVVGRKVGPLSGLRLNGCANVEFSVDNKQRTTDSSGLNQRGQMCKGQTCTTSSRLPESL